MKQHKNSSGSPTPESRETLKLSYCFSRVFLRRGQHRFVGEFAISHVQGMRTSELSPDRGKFNHEMKEKVPTLTLEKTSNGSMKDNVELLLEVEVTESLCTAMSREKCPSIEINDSVEVTIIRPMKDESSNFVPCSLQPLNEIDEGRNSKCIKNFQNRHPYKCQNESFTQDTQRSKIFSSEEISELFREYSLKNLRMTDEGGIPKDIRNLQNRRCYLSSYKRPNESSMPDTQPNGKIYSSEEISDLFREYSLKNLRMTDEGGIPKDIRNLQNCSCHHNSCKRPNESFTQDAQQNGKIFNSEEISELFKKYTLNNLRVTDEGENPKNIRDPQNRNYNHNPYKHPNETFLQDLRQNGKIFNSEQISELFKGYPLQNSKITDKNENPKVIRNLRNHNSYRRPNESFAQDTQQNDKIFTSEEISELFREYSLKNLRMTNKGELSKCMKNLRSYNCHHNPHERQNRKNVQNKQHNSKVFNVEGMSDLFRAHSLKTLNMRDVDNNTKNIRNLQNPSSHHSIYHHKNETLTQDTHQNSRVFNVEEMSDLFREHILKTLSLTRVVENSEGTKHLQSRRCHYNLYKRRNETFVQDKEQNGELFNVEEIGDTLRDLPRKCMNNRKDNSKPYCAVAKGSQSGDHCQSSGMDINTASDGHRASVVEFLKTYIKTCNSGCEIENESFRNDALVYQVHEEKSSKSQGRQFIELGVLYKILDLWKPDTFSKCNSSENIIDELQKLVADWSSNERNVENLLSNDRSLTKCEKCGVISCAQSSVVPDFCSRSRENNSPHNARVETHDSNIVQNNGEALRSEGSVRGNTFESLNNETGIRRFSNGNEERYTANENVESLMVDKHSKAGPVLGSTMTAERESDSPSNNMKTLDYSQTHQNESTMLNSNQPKIIRHKDLFCSDEFFRSSLRSSLNKPTLLTGKSKAPKNHQEKRESNNSKNERQQPIISKTGQVVKAPIYDKRKAKDANRIRSQLRKNENKPKGGKKIEEKREFVPNDDEAAKRDKKDGAEFVSPLLIRELAFEVIAEKNNVNSQSGQWKERESSVLHSSHDDDPCPESGYLLWANQRLSSGNVEEQLNQDVPLGDMDNITNDASNNASAEKLCLEYERKNDESSMMEGELHVEKGFLKDEEQSTETVSENYSGELAQFRESETTAYSSSSAENMIRQWTKPASIPCCSNKELICNIKEKISEAVEKCVNYSVISEDKLYDYEKSGIPAFDELLKGSSCEEIHESGILHLRLEPERAGNSLTVMDKKSIFSKRNKRIEKFDEVPSKFARGCIRGSGREEHSSMVDEVETLEGLESEGDDMKSCKRIIKKVADTILGDHTKNATLSVTTGDDKDSWSQKYEESIINLRRLGSSKRISRSGTSHESQIAKEVADAILNDYTKGEALSGMTACNKESCSHNCEGSDSLGLGACERITRNDTSHDSQMVKKVPCRILSDHEKGAASSKTTVDDKDSRSQKCEVSNINLGSVGPCRRITRNDTFHYSQIVKEVGDSILDDHAKKTALSTMIVYDKESWSQKCEGSNISLKRVGSSKKISRSDTSHESRIVKEVGDSILDDDTKKAALSTMIVHDKESWSQKYERLNVNPSGVGSCRRITRSDSSQESRTLKEVAEQIWGDHGIKSDSPEMSADSRNLSQNSFEKRIPTKQQYLLITAPTTNIDCTNDIMNITYKNPATLLSSSNMDKRPYYQTDSKSSMRICSKLKIDESERFERQITYDDMSSRDISMGSRRGNESSILTIYRKIFESSDEMDWETFQQLVETLHPSQKGLWCDICKAVSNEAKRMSGETGASTEVCIEINPVPPSQVFPKEERGKVKACGDEISFEMDMVLRDVETILSSKFNTAKASKSFRSVSL